MPFSPESVLAMQREISIGCWPKLEKSCPGTAKSQERGICLSRNGSVTKPSNALPVFDHMLPFQVSSLLEADEANKITNGCSSRLNAIGRELIIRITKGNTGENVLLLRDFRMLTYYL